MTPGLVTAPSLTHIRYLSRIDRPTYGNLNPNPVPRLSSFSGVNSPSKCSRRRYCLAKGSKLSGENISDPTTGRLEENFTTNIGVEKEKKQADLGWRVGVGSPNFTSFVPTAKLSLSDQAFFLLAFIACTTSVAFTSFVIAAVPTFHAMGRAAISLSKLADAAREELPSTMAAVRLTGMEISDLTLELNDLSQEIADGVNKSAQAVQAAEAGIRQIGSLARQQTMSMIQERANLPVISIRPVVAGAAKKTTRAVSDATKSFINMISGGEFIPENGNEDAVDRIEI